MPPTLVFRESVPLAPYTTFGIGGPARWFAQAASEADVLEAVLFARQHDLPLFILGGGSNLLVSDQGFSGLVLRIDLQGIAQEFVEDLTLFHCGAGEDWDAFVSLAVQHNAAGIECLAGIPGTVGGTPVQNVGAYGQEVSQTIHCVRALDLLTGNFVELPRSACDFRYRQSLFNTGSRGRYIVTRVSYALTPGGEPSILYADLKKHFAGRPAPTLAQVADAVRDIRRRKGMLLVDGDPDCHSAGSFFKNPIITDEHFAALRAQTPALDVPHYPAGDRHVKLPAAWLLEQAGFHKGYALGAAGISSRHTLALINRGGATARDIAALRDTILAAVDEKFSIRLEPEPVWVEGEAATASVAKAPDLR